MAIALASGCARHAPKAAPVANVQVAAVEARDVPIVREWIGTLDGSVNAQIHAQVSGYIVKQDYREGRMVHQGDLLFEIDDRPFVAALAQAQGGLAQAKAQLRKAELDVARDTPLVSMKAVSQQELDDATVALASARASVASAQATVDQAALNLTFAHVTSPINGIAGLVQVQIGDLVGPSTGVLTTVSTVDPIKVYFPISEQDYLALRQREPSSSGLPSDLQFSLILADGSVFPAKGSFFALDRQVAGDTGTIRVAALFANPDGVLRPGQYGRVRVVLRVDKGALTVPQRALTELQGGYQLATVDKENHVHIVSVKTGASIGDRTVVEGGVSAGDRVVAEGLQKVKEGDTVNPLPAEAAGAGK